MSISQDSPPRSGASLAASVVAAGITVADNKFTVTGSSDATKTFKFECDSVSTGVDVTYDLGSQTADRTVNMPALAANATFAMLEASVTDNAILRADGTSGKVQNSGVIIDDSNNVSGIATADITGRVAIGPGWAPGDADSLIVGHTTSIFGAITMGDSATISNDTGIYLRTTGVGHITLHGNAGSIRISANSGHTDGVRVNSSGATQAMVGLGFGTTSTATAAGTTTLTATSTVVQVFTGATTQTIQFPAANLWGAGISVIYIVINLSTGSVTPTRAGSDTFQGGGTTDTVVTNTSRIYMSDGVSVWGIVS